MHEALKHLPFWDNLTPNEQKLCETDSSVIRVQAGTYLIDDCDKGKNCLGMIHVLSGEIRAFILSEEGREISLFRMREGENCVLSASCVLSQITFDTQLFVTQDAEILVIPSRIFGKLMQSNVYARCFAYELATERFSAVMWVLQQILFLGFDKRLANFLLEEYKKTGKTEIRMTQEEVATATNSAREVVARMLKQFASDGLVESKRGIISLKNIKGLENIR